MGVLWLKSEIFFYLGFDFSIGICLIYLFWILIDVLIVLCKGLNWIIDNIEFFSLFWINLIQLLIGNKTDRGDINAEQFLMGFMWSFVVLVKYFEDLVGVVLVKAVSLWQCLLRKIRVLLLRHFHPLVDRYLVQGRNRFIR
jgi:hypothetical protein